MRDAGCGMRAAGCGRCGMGNVNRLPGEIYPHHSSLLGHCRVSRPCHPASPIPHPASRISHPASRIPHPPRWLARFSRGDSACTWKLSVYDPGRPARDLRICSWSCAFPSPFMSESQSGQPPADPSSGHAAAARAAGDDRQPAATSPFRALPGDRDRRPPRTPPAANRRGPAAPAYEHLGELPSTYGTQSVYLVAYDPHQLFVYWDVDWSATPGAAYTLHVCRADGEIETEVGITAADAGRYVPAAVRGGTYFVELGSRRRDGSWNPLAHSGRVTMPPEGLAGEDEPKFATLPFHLSFQRLLELIQGAMGNGENLTAALARLQHGDRAGMQTVADALQGLGGEPTANARNAAGPPVQRELRGRHGQPAARPARGAGRGGVRQRGAFFGGIDRPKVGGMGSEHLSSGAFGSDTDAAGVRGRDEQRDALVVHGAGCGRRQRGMADRRGGRPGRQRPGGERAWGGFPAGHRAQPRGAGRTLQRGQRRASSGGSDGLSSPGRK